MMGNKTDTVSRCAQCDHARQDTRAVSRCTDHCGRVLCQKHWRGHRDSPGLFLPVYPPDGAEVLTANDEAEPTRKPVSPETEIPG